MPTPTGIDPANRALLERLHRAHAGPFDVPAAQAVLGLTVLRTRRLLAHLAARGWLVRVRRGLYATVPLGASTPSDWRVDPWQVAMHAFAPAYIGGFSACEHWSLTEQVFRDVCVVTGRALRASEQSVQGTRFRLKQRPIDMHFGLSVVWRAQVPVRVSDPERTLADVLDDPSFGGGIRHVAEVLASWSERTERDASKLIDYAERAGNRTVFKRLGYLAETLALDEPDLIAACRDRLSSGLSKLDPSIALAGSIVKRWNLRVNAIIEARGARS